jgi:hypothetical protein
MKQHIIYAIAIVALAGWVLTLQREVSMQDKYWQVMIENSPKEVQEFFYAEVEKK